MWPSAETAGAGAGVAGSGVRRCRYEYGRVADVHGEKRWREESVIRTYLDGFLLVASWNLGSEPDALDCR